MSRQKPGPKKPRITVSAADHDKLSAIARAAVHNVPEIANRLLDELEVAHVVARGRPALDRVGLGSLVEFRDEASQRVQAYTVVQPSEADISQGRISVLTPIGAALIGLGIEQSATFETRSGELKRLTVLQVKALQPA